MEKFSNARLPIVQNGHFETIVTVTIAKADVCVLMEQKAHYLLVSVLTGSM